MEPNPYLPRPATVLSVREEVGGERPIKTFRVRFLDERDAFTHACGQCAMISAFGGGEAMISIASSPLERGHLQFSILKSGRVTTALHELREGDRVSLRGPFGNTFPIDDWRGKHLLFVGGGIGLAPLWSVIQTALGRRAEFGDLTLFYGARTASALVYREELEALRGRMGVHLSVDAAEPGWDGYVGFVPAHLLGRKPSPENTVAVTCGPPSMIKFVIANLAHLGFADGQIYTTVENKMKCGVGKCGRCNIGPHYVCKDGPVYSWAKLRTLPQEY
jgi:NAD(P)H-flavin reductase